MFWWFMNLFLLPLKILHVLLVAAADIKPVIDFSLSLSCLLSFACSSLRHNYLTERLKSFLCQFLVWVSRYVQKPVAAASWIYFHEQTCCRSQVQVDHWPQARGDRSNWLWQHLPSSMLVTLHEGASKAQLWQVFAKAAGEGGVQRAP